MTKLEAWQAWCSTAGTERLADQSRYPLADCVCVQSASRIEPLVILLLRRAHSFAHLRTRLMSSIPSKAECLAVAGVLQRELVCQPDTRYLPAISSLIRHRSDQ